jgi:hypothetical protein
LGVRPDLCAQRRRQIADLPVKTVRKQFSKTPAQGHALCAHDDFPDRAGVGIGLR